MKVLSLWSEAWGALVKYLNIILLVRNNETKEKKANK